jgi:hypothetical protein
VGGSHVCREVGLAVITGTPNVGLSHIYGMTVLVKKYVLKWINTEFSTQFYFILFYFLVNKVYEITI